MRSTTAIIHWAETMFGWSIFQTTPFFSWLDMVGFTQPNTLNPLINCFISVRLCLSSLALSIACSSYFIFDPKISFSQSLRKPSPLILMNLVYWWQSHPLISQELAEPVTQSNTTANHNAANDKTCWQIQSIPPSLTQKRIDLKGRLMFARHT